MPWPFVRRWNTNREGAPSPLAIFDQYYKNQPTDFLRKILPPCVAEYFIGVHPGTHPPPIPFLFQPPAFSRVQGGRNTGRRKEIGRREPARDFVLLRRVRPTLLECHLSMGCILAVNMESFPDIPGPVYGPTTSLLSAASFISLLPLGSMVFRSEGATVNVGQLPNQTTSPIEKHYC